MVQTQYRIKPAANGARITVKNKGININIFFCIFCISSEPEGWGESFICNHIELPINTGSSPISKKVGTLKGNKPNRLKIVKGSLALKSCQTQTNGECLIARSSNNNLYKLEQKKAVDWRSTSGPWYFHAIFITPCAFWSSDMPWLAHGSTLARFFIA